MNFINEQLDKYYNLKQEMAFSEYLKDTDLDNLEIDFEMYKMLRRVFLTSYNDGHYDAETSIKEIAQLYPNEIKRWLGIE